MRLIRALMLALAGFVLAGSPALAQPVTSAAPDQVAVTIYRAPDRSADNKISLDWLEGYALITEQRTVTIPAGRAVIGFEGVAAGILPESAIVTGLPEGVREKNLDADLLNPRNLYARSFGRPVTIQRAGEEGRGIIRSGPDGAAILQTERGFEALSCLGQDKLVYDGVPAGLSAKPTLSVETESAKGGQVTLTLSYLAWGFDWQANYVATMRPDGRSADLFAWVTLANSDVTSFQQAETAVVAGRLNRQDRRDWNQRWANPDGFSFQCMATPLPDVGMMESVQDVPMAVSAISAPAPEAIIVTGSRMKRAEMVKQEDLGDLKLYRVPSRTTVAAKSQKQVALLDKQKVPVEVIYTSAMWDDTPGGVRMMLRAQNKKEKGLGLPLPAGPVSVFEPRGGATLLVGEGVIGDKAVNEEVEIDFADATQVNVIAKDVAEGGNWSERQMIVTNANPFPIRFEASMLTSDSYVRDHVSAKLIRKNGADVWAVTVPANGTATLRFRLTETRH